MSYCRFSCMNFGCDIYAYESITGRFMIHVAAVRVVGEVPKVPHLDEVTYDEWGEALQEKSEFLQSADRRPIGLKYDGQSFAEPDLESFRSRLVELRELGYVFPDYVLEEVDAELAHAKRSEAERSEE